MADPPKVQSPAWWLDRLLAKLEAERPQLALLDNYYWGNHPLPHVPAELNAKYLAQFQELLRQSQANFMQLVIDAMANRCKVQGFRLSASTDDTPDPESMAAWNASGMKAEHRLAIRDTFVKGRGALSVWYGDPSPVIAVEDACSTIVECVPGNRRQRAAALKVWVDDWTGEDRANVYLPAGIHKFKRVHNAEKVDGAQIVPAVVPAKAPVKQSEWTELEDEFVLNKVGVVPIVPLVARPDAYGIGHSEIEGVLAIQERINGGLFNRVLAGWFAAFRQKWATGVVIPEDADGNPTEPWSQAITRMFVDTNEGAKFGTFDATDLTQYLKAHEQDVKDIASITFTPRHFLIQQGQEPSGDAINSADAPLISKVFDREEYLADGLVEALRLARMFAGESDIPIDSEIVWADPRDPSVIEAARTDAVLKQRAGGIISVEMAQERLGYTPDQISRMSDDLAAEALRAEAAAATADLLKRDSGTDTGRDAPSS